MFNIIKFKEILSTNTYALDNILTLPDKTIILAEKQLAGRGQFDRSWQSDNTSNLYFSIVLKPFDEIDKNLPVANITQYAAAVLCKVIELYHIKPQIKYPNDIMIKNKKLAGILSESSTQGQKLKGIVIGMGINLNSKKEELQKIDKPATSLNIEAGYDIDKEIFLQNITKLFFAEYENFVKKGFMLNQDHC